MARLKVISAILLCMGSTLLGANPTTRPARPFSNAALIRARNYVRPGWFLVNGLWARPQGTFAADDLFGLQVENGHDRLISYNNPQLEPLLKNWRTSLIQLNGSHFGWTLSCPRRVWNETHTSGTQNLLLIATMDNAPIGVEPALMKVEITPQQQSVQTIQRDGDLPESTVILFGVNFVQVSMGPVNGPPTLRIRSSTLQQLLIDRPTETRRDVIPVLKLINGGENPLAPAAGDVYRVFENLPADPQVMAQIERIIPDLAAPEPANRQHASERLVALGRRGVRAAMKLNPDQLPPEAADRIATYIAENTHDPRSTAALRQDPNFLLDCQTDSDPDVRAAAHAIVGR